MINVMGEADTLKAEGQEHLRMYQPDDEKLESHFYASCGSHLYVFLPDWPQWVYPFASAIDTSLPSPPEIFHVLLDEAADWVEVSEGEKHFHFRQNTEEPIEMWHQRLGLVDAGTRR